MRKPSKLDVNGQSLVLGARTWLMGVLNVTPDSFSDGGVYFDRERAVARGLEMISEGADIVDIGGESTRPGSDPVPIKEELRRVIPVISSLRKQTDCLISIDTRKEKVARDALDAGANIINDISSFQFDAKMASLAAEKEVPVVLMHMKGTPKTMQLDPFYEDVIAEIQAFLQERTQAALHAGIKREKIIVDPGIGFGKRHEDNALLIRNLHAFEVFGRPILVGISRKSFIGAILDLPPKERLEGTLAASVLSILHGAHILRVHDVASAKRAVRVVESIMEKSVLQNSHGNATPKKEDYVH